MIITAPNLLSICIRDVPVMSSWKYFALWIAAILSSDVANNHKRCILCRQDWYPREHNLDGTRSKYCRGHGLFGKQFMPNYSHPKPSSCACESKLCEMIGYSHAGMMRFPPKSNEKELKEAIRVLGIQTPEKRAKIFNNPRGFQIAPWHYDLKHLEKHEGKWRTRKLENYVDNDGKSFTFAPPNGSVRNYIDNVILPMGHDNCRGGFDILPPWVKELADCQTAHDIDQQQGNPCTTPLKSNKIPRVVSPTSPPTPRPPRKRGSPEATKIVELEEARTILQAKLNAALEHIEHLTAQVKVIDEERMQVIVERDKLLEENKELKEKIRILEEKKCVISYDDLKPGGLLANFVNDFTFLPTFKQNDLFLDLINYTDGRPKGKGFCENMKRYHHMTVEEKKKYNDDLREKLRQQKEERQAAAAGNTNTDGDAGSDLDEIMTEAIFDDNGNHDVDMDEAAMDDVPINFNTRKRKLHWKTEWLVYCFFARCNISMTRIAALFGIGRILVHDIVYAWANVLCDTLAKFFPTPTRSQMLCAYPKSVIRKFGHARIFMLLDATEIFAVTASMKSVNSILYSAYKHHSTLKWLVGCDPIGTTWDDSITEGYPGSISDPMRTFITEILEQIPFGCAVEVDKGFLIENDCAMLGIYCIRPVKFLEKQTQQSKEDVAHTQKVANSRIVIEQANGQMKNSASFFDKRIRLHQIGLADLVFRLSYLLQNFKVGFIQNRGDKKSAKGRPCKAEIRWYGGTDDGLIDVRPYVEMWGTKTELERWKILRDLPENEKLSDTDISELVLQEDWPSKLRKEHTAKLSALNSV